MAGVVGIEPTHQGRGKAPCLTAWLYPNIGAGYGFKSHTPKAADFESVVSASSTNPAFVRLPLKLSHIPTGREVFHFTMGMQFSAAIVILHGDLRYSHISR